MDRDEVEATIARYNARLAEYGPTEKALGWGDKGRSRIRFEALLSRWPLDGMRVLDFGCGFGDLYGYLAFRGNSGVRYTGIDINDSLIAVARQRYEGADFVVGDLTAGEVFADDSFDYALTSGVFNYKLRDNMKFVEDAFRQLDRVAARGFAANFLSTKVEYELDHTFHADPAAILELAYTYSNNVVLRNDYMPFEFSVFVDKATAVDPGLTVYEDYVRYQ